MPAINGENISFTLRTIISVGLNIIVAAIFLSNLQNKIQRLDEIVKDMKESQRTADSDAKLDKTKREAEMATINVRLAIIENQLKISK